MNTKAVISFSVTKNARLSILAQSIHNSLAKNAATFGTLPVDLATLSALIQEYDTYLRAKIDRSIRANVLFQEVRRKLEAALSKLGNHVNNVANGSATIVEQSGFPSYTTHRTRSSGPPPAPQKLRLKHGHVSGEIIARYQPGRRPSMNEVELSTDSPADETVWRRIGTFSAGRAVLSGLTPGELVWVRVRTLGIKNTHSDWSNPAQIRVL